MKDVVGFFQVLQECAGTSLQITQWPILSTLFPLHYSLIVLIFYAM